MIKKGFYQIVALYLVIMGLLVLYSIKVLGCSGITDVLGGFLSFGESLCFNLTKDFNVEEELSRLPESIDLSLLTDEWSIQQIDSEKMNDLIALKQENLKNIVGLTDIDTKTIYLTSNDAEAHFAFPHEIGHVMDYYHGWLSQSNEFRAIYQKEAGSYADSNYHQSPQYASSSTYEFFASVFCDIILKNAKNTESVPETVSFIQKHLDL